MGDLARLRALRGEEVRLLATAAVLLPPIALGVRLLGFERMRRLLERCAFPRRGANDPDARAETIARMVAIAGRRGPFPASCLPRALVTSWLLRRDGIEGALRIGVARGGRPFRAHAWVEVRGRPLGEDALAPERFAAFDADLGRDGGRLP
jgi:hypothetical protein